GGDEDGGDVVMVGMIWWCGCGEMAAKGDDGGDGGVTVVTVASAVVGWPEVVPEKWRREMKYVCVRLGLSK
ncbi:hypothetical protein Tco_1132464, partial [Tanacetum coccineum]